MPSQKQKMILDSPPTTPITGNKCRVLKTKSNSPEIIFPSLPTTRMPSATLPTGGGPVINFPGRRGIPKSEDSNTLSASWPNLSTTFLKRRSWAASTKTRQCWLQSSLDELGNGVEWSGAEDLAWLNDSWSAESWAESFSFSSRKEATTEPSWSWIWRCCHGIGKMSLCIFFFRQRRKVFKIRCGNYW